MRHEKTVSVSKIKPLWEPWEEDETPRKIFLFTCEEKFFHTLSLIKGCEEKKVNV